jgi:hypothetical protein
MKHKLDEIKQALTTDQTDSWFQELTWAPALMLPQGQCHHPSSTMNILIMERFDALGGMGEHKAGLTRHKAGMCYVDVVLVALKFDHKGCDVVVDLMVAHDLMG